ncbi:YczE/YyaS/YitT family protein [Planococcus sp. FY231025]|uniref:YczE/YyaS/YitT family protein n=1 Tax=Planococcus sp. FY231025 TaxID=3455699 RepID=UPI003F910025
MKYLFYVIGILLLTMGIALTIQSDFGTSPFDAVLVGLAENIGLTVGSWEVLLAFLMIGCNAILKRQKPEVLGLATALITGAGIDLWLFLGQGWTPELWYSQAVCFAAGLMLIGAGTATYLYTNFAPIPVDRLTLILQELFGITILLSRTLIYAAFLIIALLVDGPIGIGTLLTVCLGGPILHFFMHPIGKALDPILMPAKTESR